MTSEEAGEDRALLNKQLLEACLMGDRERVRRLLEEGADVNARDSCGNTPLHLAVHFGGMLDRDLGFEWITVLKWLVEKGADLNARDAEGRTPLHVAAMLGYNDAIINVLLPRADPNARDKYGKTPLHYMAERRNVSGIRLLKGGARELDPNIKDNEGRTPLHYAILKDVEDRYRYTLVALLDIGADPNVGDSEGLTPPHYALLFGWDYAARRLLEHGANANARDKRGRTPLHLAVIGAAQQRPHYFYGTVHTLFNYGADPNARDEKGRTPLHYAVFNQNVELIKLLLKKGATF